MTCRVFRELGTLSMTVRGMFLTRGSRRKFRANEPTEPREHWSGYCCKQTENNRSTSYCKTSTYKRNATCCENKFAVYTEKKKTIIVIFSSATRIADSGEKSYAIVNVHCYNVIDTN